MNKSDWELSMVTSQVLQQKKINFQDVPQATMRDYSRAGATPQVCAYSFTVILSPSPIASLATSTAFATAELI